ncbi:DUF302 domain-containing protein [Tsukamurella paurometabola]|uniref:DUF302 domain-containing protein n=1 Tax=Tsukamurella paurometabola TaxID=2061 RepID=A0A3P8KDM9_TSUPA|nr:DUF302 domain-containing protein [Tsukamurella paurometabola]MBS4102235.1 DUF302 domain-containing protein [Tsukamurella paurometabola]UEA85150.1 DUF302 domain-containing protein [Tsukamurella paurometabola]VDR37758.1 Uncharacterized conserved protein [Tsukamurella paurometabola]
MAEFTMSATIDAPYDEAVARVRAGLADAGFGVLTEIDLRATLKAKLDVDVPPKVILGACRPQLAHEALGIDPRVAALLPCNVVVSADDAAAGASLVEVMDPKVMPDFTGTAALSPVAEDARQRLGRMLEGLAA